MELSANLGPIWALQVQSSDESNRPEAKDIQFSFLSAFSVIYGPST